MSCAFDKERLTAYFDGELDAAERAETERHVKGCSECLRDLSEIKAAAGAVKGLPRARAPLSIAVGVARAIQVEGRAKRLDIWRRRALWTVAAAAGLLVILNVTFFTRPAPDTSLASAPKAAPALGTLKQFEDEARQAAEVEESADKDGKEAGAGAARLREERKALGTKSDEAPALAKEPAAPSKPRSDAAPEPAPAPKPSAAPPAPSAPAPTPAPPVTASPAPPPAPAPDARRKLEADKAPEALDRAAAKAGAAAPAARAGEAANVYTVKAEKASALRSRVEALAGRWNPAVVLQENATRKKDVASGGAGSRSPSFAAPSPAPLVVDLTPEQFEELKAELAKQGATLQAGEPEPLRGADAKAEKERAASVAAPAEEGAEKAKDAAPGRRRITLYFSDVPSRK